MPQLQSELSDEERRKNASLKVVKIETSVPCPEGLESATPCLEGKHRNTKWLVRLAFSYVMYHGFGRYSSMFVPKSILVADSQTP
jgi:hypothetical protein